MFIKNAVAVLLLLGALCLVQAAFKLSNAVSLCSIKDPKLNDCLTARGRAFLPHLVAGIKDLNILPLDPLLIPHLILQKVTNDTVSLKMEITNTKHYGYKDAYITSIKFNPKTYELEANFLVPDYVLAGMYKVSGKVLIIPISGEGPGNISFVNLDVKMNVKFAVEERADKKYLKIVDFNTIAKPKTLRYNFDTIFKQKQIAEALKLFLEENPLEVYEELRESSEGHFMDICYSVMTRFFKKIPLNQLFKDVDT